MNIIKRTNYPIMFDEFFNDFFNVKPMSVCLLYTSPSPRD